MFTKNSLLSPFMLLLLLASPVLAQEYEGHDESPRNLLSKQARVGRLTEQLLALDPYVTLTPEKIAFLDSEAARQAGFSDEVIELAQQMFEVQNKALATRQPRDISQKPWVTSGYDKLEEFLSIATEVDLAQRRGYLLSPKKGATNACGTFDNPVPTSAGEWWLGLTAYKSKSEAEKAIIKQGFHKTASYVGTNDYTKGRSYKSNWGTCSSPRFRDHGIITSKFKINTQYGECNPEVHSYSWPYTTWPLYCRWWHSTR